MLTNLRYGRVDIKMIKKITNSLGWKIVSVIAAFFLWLLVVNYEDPIVNRDFSQIPVEKQNADSITSQNKAIEYLEGEFVDLTVRGKRSIVDRLTKSDIKAYADLSKVSITGAVDIEFDIPQGVQILNKRPGDMKIALENMISVQKEVQYYFVGETAEGYVALAPTITPSVIMISGPESKVNAVSSVMVPVSIQDVTKEMTIYSVPQAMDSHKKVVEDVVANVEKVQITVPVKQKKELPITFKMIDDVQEGFVLADVSYSREDVTVMGKEDALKSIDSIIIDKISLAGKSSDFSVTVSLEDLITKEGIDVISEDKTLIISFNIEKLEQKTISIDPKDIKIKNLSSGHKVTILNTTPITLTFKGASGELSKISLLTLEPSINLAEVGAGAITLPLNYSVEEGIKLVNQPTGIKINVSTK